MAEVVAAGKAPYLGLSEVAVEEVKRARAVHPVTSVESELSVWTRDVLAEVLPYCQEQGIALLPRFQQDALRTNLALVGRVREIADRAGATPAQVALAWVIAQGRNPSGRLDGTLSATLLRLFGRNNRNNVALNEKRTPSRRARSGAWGNWPSVECQTAAMVYDEELAGRVREVVEGEPGLSERRMFGGLAFLINGNVAVSASGRGGLLLRVDPAQTETLVRDPAAHRFEMRGRELNGWLQIDAGKLSGERDLEDWVARGVAHARSLPPKR